MFHEVVARFATEAFGQSHWVLTFACVVSAAVRSYPVQDSKHMVAVHDVLLALNQGQTAQDVHKLQFADEADSSHYVPEKAFMNLDALDSLKAARLKVRQAVDFVTALDDLSDKARNSTTRFACRIGIETISKYGLETDLWPFLVVQICTTLFCS